MLAHGFSGFRPSWSGDGGRVEPFMSRQKAGEEKGWHCTGFLCSAFYPLQAPPHKLEPLATRAGLRP